MEIGCKFLWPIISQDPILKKCFSHNNEGKQPMQQNQIFKIPNLDVSIENFVKFGSKYFTEGLGATHFLSCYNSDLKQLFPIEIQSLQLISPENLASYQVQWYDPLEVAYKDSTIFLPPSPSQVKIFLFNQIF